MRKLNFWAKMAYEKKPVKLKCFVVKKVLELSWMTFMKRLKIRAEKPAFITS